MVGVDQDLGTVDIPVRRGELLHRKYLIGEPLGSGGMGVVVAAENVQLGQKVAIKFLSDRLRWDEKALVRFLREARNAAQIRSEHVVRVLDVSSTDGSTCYMVIEYLEGEDLAAILRRRGPVSTAEAVGYVLQACEAIVEAHGLGIVHRDLKPSNLFVTRRRDGSPLLKVLDFGISKLAIAESAGDGTDHLRRPDLTSTRAIVPRTQPLPEGGIST